jgi:hypothetical protein
VAGSLDFGHLMCRDQNASIGEWSLELDALSPVLRYLEAPWEKKQVRLGNQGRDGVIACKWIDEFIAACSKFNSGGIFLNEVHDLIEVCQR